MQALLKGSSISGVDPANGRAYSIQLGRPEQRRLFAFLLGSDVRSAKGLRTTFIANLKGAFAAQGDPASEARDVLVMDTGRRTWFLKRVETYGFGGVNSCYLSRDSACFSLDVAGQSLCLEGPNGSGKSSFVGAIMWALTGERPCDHNGPTPSMSESHPVYGTDGALLRSWPPVAAYPEEVGAFPVWPRVGVKLVFEDPGTGEEVVVKRTLTKDGQRAEIDPRLAAVEQLFEIAVVMPSRLEHLRFGEKGRLGAAIEALTGLNKLKNLGEFVSGLCNGNQEFLRYAKRERQSDHQAAYDAALQKAKQKLPSGVIDFDRLISLGAPKLDESLSQAKSSADVEAGRRLEVLKNDVHDGLNLRGPEHQKRVVAAVVQAREDVRAGLGALQVVQVLDRARQALSSGELTELAARLAHIEGQLAESLVWHERQQTDNKLRLKVLAARWHRRFHQDADKVTSCPLCEQPLEAAPELAEELTRLRSEGITAEQTLREATARLREELWNATPQQIRGDIEQIDELRPKQGLLSGLRERYVVHERYARVLIGASKLVKDNVHSLEHGLPGFPELEQFDSNDEAGLPELRPLATLIRNVRRFIRLGTWWRDHAPAYEAFWETVAGTPDADSRYPVGTLNYHLAKLDEALTTAEPYREASEHLTQAIGAEKKWREIQKEQNLRVQIAEALSPLKDLRGLVEAEANDAIHSLSGKIDAILSRIYLIDRLKYKGTKVNKQAVTIHGSFCDTFNIDATLVANGSWLRAILWAFILALREEALENLKYNPFPLVLLDDPQATFDIQHRRKWAEQIAALDNLKTKDLHKAQFLIATHDTAFVDNLRIEGFRGRLVKLDPINPETGTLTIVDGARLERLWKEAEAKKTSAAAREYIGQVRVDAETLLRLMLRGEGPVLPSPTWANLRQKLQNLSEAGVPPYDRPVFKRLLGSIQQSVKEVQLINRPHHYKDDDLGYAQAVEVERHWRKNLGLAIREAFDTCRDYRSVNGELRALFASSSTERLPEGLKDAVRNIPLTLQGRAAAMTAGRAADGRLAVHDYPEGERERWALVNHSVYRLTSPTLEPVASPGDLLIVSNAADVHGKNLVVCGVDDRIVARRFDLADGKAELAVLTAQSVNPYDINAPLVVHASSIEPKKIVGVLYDPGSPFRPSTGKDEVLALDGEASLNTVVGDLLGLYRIEGRSAEPYALDEQYILVRRPSSSRERLKRLDGRLILAVDNSGAHFFKRLRVLSEGIILESLDLSGREGPILLSETDGSHVTEVMEVVGILFEAPQERTTDMRLAAASASSACEPNRQPRPA